MSCNTCGRRDVPDLRADVLEHLNTHERIKGVLKLRRDVSIVHQVHPNTALQAALVHALLRELLLLHRERERVDGRARDRRRDENRERAPS